MGRTKKPVTLLMLAHAEGPDRVEIRTFLLWGMHPCKSVLWWGIGWVVSCFTLKKDHEKFFSNYILETKIWDTPVMAKSKFYRQRGGKQKAGNRRGGGNRKSAMILMKFYFLHVCILNMFKHSWVFSFENEAQTTCYRTCGLPFIKGVIFSLSGFLGACKIRWKYPVHLQFCEWT